jgi:NAD(P)H-hydrate repair Nnr-like enzyme with NAD(P)H-hydrate epimerase domain
MREVAEAAGVDRVALRNGARYVARLVRLQVPLAADIYPGRCLVLVTGGLGALGLLVARHLVERGARHLTLVGRREPSDAARAVIRDLEATGATITHLAPTSRAPTSRSW